MEASSSSQDHRQRGAFVTTSVDHSRLAGLDAEFIRIFLRRYKTYCREVTAPVEQLVATGTISSEPVRPISIKYCVNSEQLKSALDLGHIKDVADYEDLTDTELKRFLEARSQESKKKLTSSDLEILVDKELRMDMSIRSARSRMELLFMGYVFLLRRNGLKWVLTSNQKLAVLHIASAVQSQSLRRRLESDLDFAHTKLRKGFNEFMEQVLSVSEAFEKIDTGPPSGRGNTKHKPNSRVGGGSLNSQGDVNTSTSNKTHTPIRTRNPRQHTDPESHGEHRHRVPILIANRSVDVIG